MLFFAMFLNLCAFQSAPEWVVDKTAHSFDITPGSIIEVVNPYGDVRARSTNKKSVSLTALRQGIKDEAQVIELKVDHQRGHLKLEVVYPGKETETVKKGGKRRMDLTVYVPDQTLYRVTTDRGLVEVKGLKANIEAKTFSGKMFLKFSGHLIAESYQGNINAVFLDTKWRNPSKITSTLGTITAEFGKQANLSIEGVTSGHITADYSTTLKKEDQKRHVQITIGNGGNKLELVNGTGDLKILEGNWQ